MPEHKGRKRKHPRGRRPGGEIGTQAAVERQPRAAAPASARRPAASDGPLPSTAARVTGMMIAVLTAFLAILMMYQAATGDSSGIDAVVRIVAGVTLVALAVVVGLLSLAPGQVRDWLRRRR
jgi:hypothetical protein